MRLRRVVPLFAGLSCLGVSMLASPVASGADKASIACIQEAEDGQSARSTGDLLHARDEFTRCAAHDCPTVLRRDCATWLDETVRQIPSIVIGAHDAHGHDVLEATATVDGVRAQVRLDGTALDLNPGPHVIRVESPQPTAEMRVVLRAGEKNRPILATLGPPPAPPPAVVAPVAPATPPPAPPPVVVSHRHVPAGAYILGGVGLVGFGAFAYFGLKGNHDADKLHSTCAPACSSSQVDTPRNEFRFADVGLGVGVLGVAAATWVAIHGLTRKETTASESAWQVEVGPMRGGAAAGVRASF